MDDACLITAALDELREQFMNLQPLQMCHGELPESIIMLHMQSGIFCCLSSTLQEEPEAGQKDPAGDQTRQQLVDIPAEVWCHGAWQ